MMQKTVAIFSPNKNSYSETFIQAQKKICFPIRFYYNGHLPSELEGKGHIVRYSKLNRMYRRIDNRLTIAERCLVKSLVNENIKCVLVQYGPTACETLNVIKFLNLPLIVHFHGYDASNENVLKHYGDKYLEVFKYADAVICVSTKMKLRLIELGCPAEKLHLIIYGPHPDYFLLQPNYQQPLFLAVGRFTDKKAPQLTLMAFKKVLETFPNASLLMVGDGDLMHSCRSLTRALKINNVTFKGVLHIEDIRTLMEQSIAFIQHSIVAGNGDSEGTPVAILEAQAGGLPVISTNHAGIPEVVLHGTTGFLVEEYDVDGMADYMIRIISENGLAKNLGQAGKIRVNTFFTMEKYLHSLEAIIRKSILVTGNEV